MCGLVALFSPEAPVCAARVERGLEALVHRGPDGRGVWTAPGGEAALGHVRLAIVDPAGGAQPLASEDGAVVAVVTGELYDDARIRADLERRGHRFRTRSDSEILLHLYEEHGEDCLRHLRGEFAFALWDARARRLFCARDRFGVRPLVYARAGGALLVASEAKALFAMGVPARWDAAALAFAMHAQYTQEDRTLFEGVRQVPPGTMLTATSAGVRTARWWDLDVPRAEEKLAPPEVASALGERLDEAVRLRMRADVPVAFQLSGGLDSSAVAALAARRARGPITCFTVSFDHDDYDELGLAQQTADRLGARLITVRASQQDLARALPDAIAHGEGLVVNAHAAAKFLLSRAVRDAGFRVVMTGEGADEVLAGYPHFRRDGLLAAGAGADRVARLAAANGASAGIMMPVGEGLPLDAVRSALGFVPSWMEAKAALGRRVTSLAAPGFLRAHAAGDPYAQMVASFDPAQLAGRDRVDQAAYTWTKLALAGYILRTLGDGMEMAHSVEGRLPMLDHELFAFVRTLPTEVKIAGEVEKHVLREAMAPLLPEAVVRRRKHPFMAPPLWRAGSAARALADDVLRGPSLPPAFDRAAVVRRLEGLDALSPAERHAWDPALMMVLSASLLEARYRLGAS